MVSFQRELFEITATPFEHKNYTQFRKTNPPEKFYQLLGILNIEQLNPQISFHFKPTLQYIEKKTFNIKLVFKYFLYILFEPLFKI